jgi:hypothetical protein
MIGRMSTPDNAIGMPRRSLTGRLGCPEGSGSSSRHCGCPHFAIVLGTTVAYALA